MQDESNRKESVRYRNWDTCGLALFTLHTSGHNPRSTQTARWRQRVMHKLSYMPQRFNLTACMGCGRCSRLCPNGLAISETCEKIARLCEAKPKRGKAMNIYKPAAMRLLDVREEAPDVRTFKLEFLETAARAEFFSQYKVGQFGHSREQRPQPMHAVRLNRCGM